MRVFAGMDPRLRLAEVAAHVRRVEAMGYDGIHVAETIHDALAVALLAVEHSEAMVVRTSVALAFPRSPTLTAYAAWDLAQLSGGRFELGLGTQIRQNIEDRYGIAWSDPVAWMSEYLDALDELFEAFRTGGVPHADGPRYRISRLQPYFNPGPDEATAAPPLWLGGVNPGICRLAGSRAAGFVTHPTNSSPRYLEAVCLPNLATGAAGRGRDPRAVELVVGTPVITGRSRAELDAAREHQRRMFAFLYSTPAYRVALDLHGWGDLTERLQAMIRAGRWDDLGPLVTDEVLDALVPCAPYAELAAELVRRFGHLADGVVLNPPADPGADAAVAEVVAALQQTPSRRRLEGGTAPPSPTPI